LPSFEKIVSGYKANAGRLSTEVCISAYKNDDAGNDQPAITPEPEDEFDERLVRANRSPAETKVSAKIPKIRKSI
jgi:hypothetical protein